MPDENTLFEMTHSEALRFLAALEQAGNLNGYIMAFHVRHFDSQTGLIDRPGLLKEITERCAEG
jgi:hypothetical protein